MRAEVLPLLEGKMAAELRLLQAHAESDQVTKTPIEYFTALTADEERLFTKK